MLENVSVDEREIMTAMYNLGIKGVCLAAESPRHNQILPPQYTQSHFHHFI